jgi:glucose-1-phosphate cytidylyltransferase
MKVIILAGGLGTRLNEYTHLIPKPMVKIGPHPMIIHIMNHYVKYGFTDFILATGYKSYVFKNTGDIFKAKLLKKICKINILDTGKNTLTGGRLKRVSKYLKKDETFMFTYGDGISNINIRNLISFHNKKKRLITVTAVRPPARFGEIIIKKNIVSSFKEKPQTSDSWINGGFFVTNSNFLKFIRSDKEILEKWPLEQATKKKQLTAYKHFGFWKCMDVKRDREELQRIYKKNKFNF